MAVYDLEYKSRRMYVGNDETSFGELVDTTLLLEYNDDGSATDVFAINLYSDGARYRCPTDAALKVAVTEEVTTGLIQTRAGVQAVAQEGFFGRFFENEFVKKCPADGVFVFLGSLTRYASLPMVDQDVMAIGGPISDNTQ